ncbi:MAG: phosphomannomutase/phosphoglucomutase [Clostridia bacterium]|nr:phosphomannomutase/phosphoglucomutase [Clostridia bacterium]
MKDYKKLQNGSDIRGKDLTKLEAYDLTLGFAKWLCLKTGKAPSALVFAVGHDSRESGPMLKEAVIEAFTSIGATVYDAKLASTPAMFMATVFEEYMVDGSIMITASHLPQDRNGFKYFSKEGGLNKEDIAKIIKYAEEGVNLPKASGKVIVSDLMDRYASHLRNLIKAKVPSLEGLKIMVDAGNGAGGFYAHKVLKPLGADVSSSQFLEPDGSFPNHVPNPEDKDAIASACKRVKETGADLGLIFDTDVDRVAAIDRNGNEISRDRIVALAAALIAVEYPKTTVVTDSITSPELTQYLEECLGLKHLRYMRGYRNVINKAIELGDSQLAIETSGHAAYKENYFLDDGAYLATKIVIKAAQIGDISCMISPLKMPLESIEKRFPIKDMDTVLYNLEHWDKIDGKSIKLVTPNYEGVRLEFDMPGLKGWCLLRKSLHDPIMPLNVQVSEGNCDKILEMLEDIIKDQS